MSLDLRTIYVVTAVTLVVLGVFQFAAYCTGRFQRWPLWWSGSNILIGTGIFLVSMRGIASDFLTVTLGNTAILCGYVAMFGAVRIFAQRFALVRSGVFVMLASAIFFASLLADENGTSMRAVGGSVFCCLIDLAIVREGFRLGRRERLWAGWCLAALYATTALVFAMRALYAFTTRADTESLFASVDATHIFLTLFALMFVMMRSMAMLLMASERSYNEATELAHRDPLTGVLNRAGMLRAIASYGGTTHTALVIDIDHFKALNDQHGHKAGDEILRLFAEVASRHLRGDDLLGRHGGDEFVAVLKDIASDQALHIAERIRNAFVVAVKARPDLLVHPTLSIGVAHEEADARAFEQLLQRADDALYRSKRLGRNQVACTGDSAAVAA